MDEAEQVDAREEALRQGEARNAYLVRLGDALKRLSDPVAVKRTAMQILGERLGVNRAFYSEFDGDDLLVDEAYERDVSPLPLGRYPNTPRSPWMREALRAGRAVIIHDFRSDPRVELARREQNLRLHLVAAVTVPMVKDGRLVSALTVHRKVTHHWTDDEVRLIEETAERTWEAVERARAAAALRESEQVARSLLADAIAGRALAEAAVRVKDEFLATLGHELRTPLAAILLWARALRSGAVPFSKSATAIDAIVQSAENQSRVIEDLLDLSRLTSGKLELRPSIVALQELVEEAFATVKSTATAKGITVTVGIEPALGRAWLDQLRVKQILSNLLSNAVKFTPDGGTVKISVARTDGVLELEVTDDGEGIDAAFLPHVFEKFRQADMTDTRRHMGLGIGLALAKRLTELHGGTIEAASEGLGRGTTFRVRVPWLPAGDAPPREPVPVSPLRGLCTLLVEDDISTRLALTASLEHAGARVMAFGESGEALAQLASGLEVDVVVSDLDLPQRSGLQLIAQIGRMFRERGRPSPPSCALSAHGYDVDRAAVIEAGFDLYLAKPITPERLVEAVADLSDVARASGRL